MIKHSMFLAAALSVAAIGPAYAKTHNDNGALAAAGLLGGALGFLSGNYYSQPSYGHSSGYGQSYGYQQPSFYNQQPGYYNQQPGYYQPQRPSYYPQPSYYGQQQQPYYATPPGYVLVPSPGCCSR